MSEKSLFTVSEDDMTEELICVAEDDLPHRLAPAHSMPDLEVVEGEDEEKRPDWRETKDARHFEAFLNSEMARLPKPHTIRGNKSLLERALGQYKKLDTYISTALRADYDGHIHTQRVDEIRRVIEAYIDEIQNALDGMEHMKKQKRQMRRRGEDESGELVKEATTPPFKGLQAQVSMFEVAIVRAIINGAVAGGRNVEELFELADKKYKFTEREELALLQLLADFGYVVFKDRLTLGDKDVDPTKEGGVAEWANQYYA
jgi:hypothetical protein